MVLTRQGMVILIGIILVILSGLVLKYIEL